MYEKCKKDTVIFPNGSNYSYYFIIKEPAKIFAGQFKCLEKHTEKYITISVPISKEIENDKIITDKTKFSVSFIHYHQLLMIILLKGSTVITA